MIAVGNEAARKRVAIMQPYFLPYIGYFQLMASADLFVIYDNIKYTKKGWINRNRMLLNGSDAVFSIPLRSDADHLHVMDRTLSDAFDREKMLNQFRGAYQKAPYFRETFEFISRIVRTEEQNLFRFIKSSVLEIASYLDIHTPLINSSDVNIDHELKAQEKVLAICNSLGATEYINPIGGTELYARDAFAERGIRLHFMSAKPFEYQQFGDTFVPWLSILDVLMFNPRAAVAERVHHGMEIL